MENKNKVNVKIYGTDYTILTEENEEYILELAYELDSDMKKLCQRSTRFTATSAAVLCALEYLDKKNKEEGTSDRMRLQINDYIQDTAKARIELDDAKRKIERLEREIDRLRAELR
ncbi:MAG: cell division protein ZapA [Oscillospiraceae bacterium]|nr:cell division protein ZapA [Oscillospiraceae bacterium]